MPNYDLITILGPTASGKTPFAAALAYELNTEIISADSRQIYRGMDLGTGKDLADYTVNGHKIPYHLIDIAAPGYKYNVFEYQQDFLVSYETVKQKGCLPVLCGGTGMYLESVLKEREFPKLNSLIIGVDIERELRREKITLRLKQRLDEGMVDEVRQLIREGISPEDLIYYGLEYKYLTLYVTGQMTYEEMFNGLETAIHQFAKRQMTWFRGMERRGFTIHWISSKLPMEEKIAFVKEKLQGN